MRAKSFLIPAAAGLAFLLAAPAAAAGDDDAVTAPVFAGDLDLSQPADALRLRGRLARAASAVCLAPGMHGGRAYRAFQACRSDALGRAGLQADRAVAAARLRGGGRVQAARR